MEIPYALIGTIVSIITVVCISLQVAVMKNQAKLMEKQSRLMEEQVQVMNQSLQADHERRRKQSTIEYINIIRAKYRTLNEKLISVFGRDHIINVTEIDETMRSDIGELLSTVEHMSVGVNIGVYDIHILERMSGSYMIKMFQRLQPYISHVRSVKKNDSAYIEFEEVKLQLEALRRKPRDQRGKMQYAPENLILLGRTEGVSTP